MLVVYAIFLLSGTAGLGYQFTWTRMFTTGLGHELPSMLAVVAAFFGGLAVGSVVLDRRVSRSPVPGRWYAALEMVIAAWGLASIALIPAANALAARLIGLEAPAWRHWSVSFAVPFVVLLPATAAMGATFPAMERLAARLRGRGRSVAGVYAANTLGAVTGTLVTTFVVIPAVGYARAVVALVAVNLLCAAATVLGPARGEAARKPVHVPFADQPGCVRVLVTVFATGLLGVGYEVLGVRVMSQALENTVFTFASALSVYLFGTAVGAALYARFFRSDAFLPAVSRLLCTVVVTILAGILAMSRSIEIYEDLRSALGQGTVASIGAELALAALVFLLPTMAMGALFSHLAQAARRAADGVGVAMGLNTLGGALAPFVFGVALLPTLGSLPALLVLAGAYLLLLPRGALRSKHLFPLGAALLLVPFLPGSLLLVRAPEGTRVIDAREGVRAAVTVLEDGKGARYLKVNDRFFMGGIAGAFAERRQGHIPLMLHPAPRRALFLGVGTGVTSGAAAAHPGVEVRAVELLPAVVDLLPRFDPDNRYEHLGRGAYAVADARRFVRVETGAYDVIVADLFHPARDGAGALYTVEHFEAARERLAEGGLFCQWLPLYQLDDERVRLIVRTFLHVFPEATGHVAHFNVQTPMLGLIGWRGPAPVRDAEWITTRGTAEAARAMLELVALDREISLFGTLVATSAALDRYAGAGPLNTDDHPRVIFEAPFAVYHELPPAHERLFAVLAANGDDDPAAAAGVADEAFVAALGEYVRARDLFLRALVAKDAGRFDDARALLVESIVGSAEFRTAYVAGLQLAAQRFPDDRDGAVELLRAMMRARPDDPRARELLRRLTRRR
jgi:spermidine synthase